MTYLEFLRSKIEIAPETGFEVGDGEIHPALKPHQRDAVRWALRALKAGRRGLMTELNEGYFRDAVGYLDAEEEKIETPTLFDLMDGQDRSAG